MSEPSSGATAPDTLFLGLVQSFQVAAMQQLGKTMNPFTKRIERDLLQAKLSIDMLEMLRVRTSGNLTSKETRFLDHVLTELRLNYVAEIEEEDQTKPAGPGGGAAAETEERAEMGERAGTDAGDGGASGGS